MTQALGRRARMPFILLTMTCFLLLSPALQAGAQRGLSLCYRTIIPSVFPFAVLSSCLVAAGDGGREFPLFRCLFALPSSAVFPFLIGLLCGFPLGAKAAVDGYRRGLYSKSEAERILCFANNTGVSFVIGGVGISLFGDARKGIYLFFLQTALALLVAFVSGRFANRGEDVAPSPLPPPLKSLSLSACIADATHATLTVCGFVVFFSCLCSMLGTFLGGIPYVALCALLEVGGACHAAAGVSGGIAFAAFAICFSGVSVHLQTAALTEGTDLSLAPYFVSKALCGALALLFTLLIGIL